MTPHIAHVGLEIVAKTADEAHQIAQTFNDEHLGGKMKPIIKPFGQHWQTQRSWQLPSTKTT